MDNVRIGARQLAPQLGVTVQQLRGWIRAGYVVPIHHGHGAAMEWPASELAVAELMVRLLAAQMEMGQAAAVARTAILFEQPEVTIGRGLVLKIGPLDG